VFHFVDGTPEFYFQQNGLPVADLDNSIGMGTQIECGVNIVKQISDSGIDAEKENKNIGKNLRLNTGDQMKRETKN